MVLIPVPEARIVTTLDEEAVRCFVAAGTGLDFDDEVIVGNSKGPRPKGLYASVLRRPGISNGYPAFEYQPDGSVATENIRTATFSVQFYRAGASALGDRFAEWTRSEVGLDLEEMLGLRVQNFIEFLRVDTETGDAIEERVAGDMTITYLHSVIEEPPTLTAVSAIIEPEGYERETIEWPT